MWGLREDVQPVGRWQVDECVAATEVRAEVVAEVGEWSASTFLLRARRRA